MSGDQPDERGERGERGERRVIINTASIEPFEGQTGRATYFASKGGGVAMSLPIARKLTRHSIRVMSIARGVIETPMLLAIPPDVQESVGRMLLFPARLGKPSEFAGLVRQIFENPYLNGELIHLDCAIRMGAKQAYQENTMIDPVVVVAARRTPIGAFQGQFSTLTAPQLGSAAITGALSDLGDHAAAIDEAALGCCLLAGLKQAPARQAVLGAGLPASVPATTLSKMCGSGMKATMLIHDMLLAGSCTVGLAGGMESMTNAPYLLPRARDGYRLGHGQVLDHMFLDGLEDAYEGKLMGYYADVTAAEQGISRERQDTYALESVRRAQHAVSSGAFRHEIAAVTLASKNGGGTVVEDETPGRCDAAKIPLLKAAFRKDGTVTPANASSISDGAAALILMRETEAARRGLSPLVRICAHATHAQAPALFTTAPATAIRNVLRKAGWSIDDVDLFEINEAFAIVTLLAMDALNLPVEKINVNGGACALGHPVGATGARLIVTLIHALRQRGLKRGIASLCIGGGEATAIAIEVL